MHCQYIDNLDLLILLQNGDFSSSLWDWANQKHGKHNSAVRFNSRHRHLTGKSHKLISFHLNVLMTGSVDWKTLNIGRILITKIVKMMCCHMIVNDLKALCYRYSILFILWLINLNVKLFLHVDFKRLHNICTMYTSTHIYNLYNFSFHVWQEIEFCRNIGFPKLFKVRYEIILKKLPDLVI